MKKNINLTISNLFTMIYKYIFGFFKVVIGIIKMDCFYCVSGIYNILLGGCKNMFLYGKNKKKETQYKIFKDIAVMIIVASLLYIIYSCSFFIYPHQYTRLGIVPIIIIAIFSFFDILISLYGVFKNMVKKDIMSIGSKCISLTCANSCAAFTQVCIIELFVNNYNYKIISIVNGIIGIIVGILCLLIGIAMIKIILKSYSKVENI